MLFFTKQFTINQKPFAGASTQQTGGSAELFGGEAKGF